MMLYKVNDEYFNTEPEAIEYSKSAIDNEYNNKNNKKQKPHNNNYNIVP